MRSSTRLFAVEITVTLSPPGFTTHSRLPSRESVIGLEFVASENSAAGAAPGATSRPTSTARATRPERVLRG